MKTTRELTWFESVVLEVFECIVCYTIIYIQQIIFYEYKYVKFVGNWGKQYYCEFSYKW